MYETQTVTRGLHPGTTPTTELQLGGCSRSGSATARSKCEHSNEQPPPPEWLSVENSSFPLKSSGSMGEAEEWKPAASEGHFSPLDTVTVSLKVLGAGAVYRYVHTERPHR